MQVVLTKDIPRLGQKGQLVSVKKGYFKNFLAPQSLAMLATSNVIEKAAELTAQIEEEKAAMAANAVQLKADIEGKELHITEKLTEKGTLYAKVSTAEIKDGLHAQFKLTVEEKAIKLKKAIKEVGTYQVDLQLSPEVTASLKVVIEGEEA